MQQCFDKLGKIQLNADEKLVMVDSGSFCHAINAATELPDHDVRPVPPSDKCTESESACGGIIKQHGKVRTRGLVEDQPLDIRWNAMDVKVPILSVRKLVRDNHNVKFHDRGGHILNLSTRSKNPFFEYQGVYYLKMKILPPDSSSAISESEPVFNRPV